MDSRKISFPGTRLSTTSVQGLLVGMSTTMVSTASPHASPLFFPLPSGPLHVCALHTAKTRLSPLLSLFLTPLSSRTQPRVLVSSPTTWGNPVVDPAHPFTRDATSTAPPRPGPPLGPTSTAACSHTPTTFNLSLTGISPTRVINTPYPSGNGIINHSRYQL